MRHIFRILKFTSGLWRYYAAISVLTVLTSITMVLMPLFSGWAIDEIGQGTAGSVTYVVWLAILLFAMDVMGNFLSNINGYLGDQLAGKLLRTLSIRYYEHLLELPQSYFDRSLSGKTIGRLNRSVQQLSSFIQVLSNNFMQFIVSTILALIFVFYYSWVVGVLLLSLYPLYVWLTIRTSDKWQKYQTEKNLNVDIASGRFAEVIAQVKVVKSYIQEKSELTYFGKYLNKAVKINQPQSKYWHVRDVRRRLLLNVIFLGVYLYIFVSAINGDMTPGVAVALILYAQQIRIPIFTISFLVDSTQRAISDSKDYFEVMDEKPLITDIPDAKPLQVSDAAVSFADVAFAYDKKPVLKDINFVVEPDSKVALVGESGEGKTTITNLLMRLYEPQSGSITIDGQDINQVTQASLRGAIGVVFQEPALFSGTIRENIAYANPKASQKDIEAAAKAANAHEFVSKFDKAYDTEIGERGLKLSGGQKQRIAIARAILKDAPILILDEATSSLDSKSEAMVQEALERLMKGRTTIIIAHRLSTIQMVDKIITIRNGKVDEVGTPHQLARTDGIYAKLLALQNRAPTERTKKQLQEYEISS